MAIGGAGFSAVAIAGSASSATRAARIGADNLHLYLYMIGKLDCVLVQSDHQTSGAPECPAVAQ
jgi:hypothetical protein